MRSFLMVVAAAAFLAAGTTAVRAQGEFPLRYVVAEENDPLLTILGVSYRGGVSEQPPDIKVLPKGLSDKVRYFRILVGGKPVCAALDAASPPKLYVDVAGTGDLSAVTPLVGKANGRECHYGPVVISTGTGEGAPTVKVLFVSIKLVERPGYSVPPGAETYDNVGVRAAGYMAGDVKLDGRTCRVAVLDKDLNGRYESAFGANGKIVFWWQPDWIAIDSNQDGKFIFIYGGDGSEIMPLVKAVRVRDVYYRVQVAPDGSSIRLEKYEPKMGTLDVGIAASLEVFSDTGLHNLGASDGKWQVPEGKYMCSGDLLLSISKIDADGKEWRLEGLDAGPLEKFEVRGGETTAFKIGPPLTLKVDAERSESGRIALNLALAGKGGETYSVGLRLQKGTMRLLPPHLLPPRLPPPKVKVFDASGKLLTEGNSEFG